MFPSLLKVSPLVVVPRLPGQGTGVQQKLTKAGGESWILVLQYLNDQKEICLFSHSEGENPSLPAKSKSV